METDRSRSHLTQVCSSPVGSLTVDRRRGLTMDRRGTGDNTHLQARRMFPIGIPAPREIDDRACGHHAGGSDSDSRRADEAADDVAGSSGSQGDAVGMSIGGNQCECSICHDRGPRKCSHWWFVLDATREPVS